MRKPLQGVWNILRFNWHFHLAAAIAVFLALILASLLPEPWPAILIVGSLGILVTVLFSIAASAWAYDFSDLYALNWLDSDASGTLTNIHAGFDETSSLLSARCPNAQLHVLDFYDPDQHTEISIRRARRAYPAFPGTRTVNCDALPFPDESTDVVILFLAAHEIRDATEREVFFREVHRILGLGGTLYVTEHLRDLPNFLAYTVGFLHFYSRRTWMDVFAKSSFQISREFTHSPFIHTFILKSDGTAP